ncbi:MAG: IclR family transcriptional regulator [Bradyrhizobium sp.]|uniref:IclR family transcriptional regulator n=1 Tax=Bradyrhizobium sp. TaxID=376 RepID=UPI003D0A5C69
MDKAFIKGLRLLEALAQSEEPRGISDLASELKLTKSNVHRLLATLQTRGYVHQLSENSRYELSTKLWQLGTQVMGRNTLIKLARPAMQRLAEVTRETVHLSVLEDIFVVYIDKIDGSQHIRAHTRLGSRAPAFTVASGKAMLTHKPDDFLELFRPHLKRYTQTTRMTITDIRKDVGLARTQGYATVLHGEWREGIAACACAIVGRGGHLEGAIGFSGPDTRIKRKQLKDYSIHVVEAARAIGSELGHSSE